MSDMSETPTWITTAPLTIEASGVAAPVAMQEHDALHPGTRLDEFEILRVLGAGGFGIVYLALDHVLMRQVAIKEFMPAALAARGKGAIVSVRSASLADTFATGLNSFFNEAQLLASFDHPALVKVHRFWKANGTAYMVMPYYPGQTLKEVRGAMPTPPDEAWLRSLLEPLLGALELLHREGVYHRDIAPDNILLLPDGRPVLLDFGSARRVIGDRTQALTAILKPNFAPVEQYADEAGMKQGPWTDLYALGATMHFVLTGRAPVPAVMRAVRDAMPALSAPEGAPFPGVSTPFLAAIDWTLALAPEDRPQSVASMRQAFSGEVVPPVPSSRHADLHRTPELEQVPGSRMLARADVEIALDAVPGPDIAAQALQTGVASTAAAAPGRLSSPSPRRTHKSLVAIVALFGLGVLGWAVWALSPSAPSPGEAAPPIATTAAGVRPTDVRKTSPPTPTSTQVKTRSLDSPPAPTRAQRPDKAPAPAAKVAAGPRSPKEACGDLNFFARRLCLSRTCEAAAWRAHPQCVELRRVEDQRRRLKEQ